VTLNRAEDWDPATDKPSDIVAGDHDLANLPMWTTDVSAVIGR
jgi:hypothetical protein